MILRKICTVAVLSAAAVVVPAAAASANGCDTAGGQVCTETVLGYAGAGVDAGSGEAFVVVGNDELGYLGVSNWETGEEPECGTVTSEDEGEGGTGTNSGGCYGGNEDPVNVGALTGGAVPLPVCGDDTGEFDDSTRDGCRNSAVDDTVDLVNGVVTVVTELLP